MVSLSGGHSVSDLPNGQSSHSPVCYPAPTNSLGVIYGYSLRKQGFVLSMKSAMAGLESK